MRRSQRTRCVVAVRMRHVDVKNCHFRMEDACRYDRLATVIDSDRVISTQLCSSAMVSALS